jgi:hypothetical protein
MILFALFKMSDIPEYATLSELVYILDKDSLLNFLECFGGLTIKVPTIKELKQIINTLLLYQLVQIEKIPMKEALEQLSLKEFQNKDILDSYGKICGILESYNFKRD